MKDKKYKSGFKVPENYFDNFDERLFKTIESETLPKETGFKVPDGYFDNLEDSLLQKLNTEEKPQRFLH